MAKFVKGDVIVLPFPFSDLTTAKRRPALVLTALEGEDLILCQITSKTIKDSYAVSIEDEHFAEGSLRQSSNIRPNRIFTANSHIVLYKVGHLKNEKVNEITERVIHILRS
jgi:mRNA interferase MazF